MTLMIGRLWVRCAGLLAVVVLGTAVAEGQQPTLYFSPGNVVVAVEGCGVQGGTCTGVPNGTGDGTGNSSVGGYGDNQASPLSLFQYKVNGTSSASYVNVLDLGSGASPVSGEYGSSSEGTLQLSGNGQYLTIAGYGVSAPLFNANPAAYGTVGTDALAQSGSLTGQGYLPVPRVPVLVDPYGNVNSNSAIYNIFNGNNPRSAYTLDGSSVYLSGQGTSPDATGGVFYSPLLVTNYAPTAITGLDATNNTDAQDTREVQVYNGTLYVSMDTKAGSGNNRSFVGTLGKPPATSLYAGGAGPTELNLANNASSPVAVTSTGKLNLTASETNGLNSAGQQINLSPSNFFFANPATLYVADTGNPKQTSATSPNGDGGLQKWVNTKADGSGTWELVYTIAAGLNLVLNPTAKPANTVGSTGLYSVTGTVSSNTVNLYAVNQTIGDLDPTYLYGVTDTLSATTNPGETFVQLAAAPSDSNFKGVSMAPMLPAGGATITSFPEGFSVTVSGNGCEPGTYVTPVTLTWVPGSTCQLTTYSPQVSGNLLYALYHWQDGSTGNTDTVIAGSTAAVYTASFITTMLNTQYIPTVFVADSFNVERWMAPNPYLYDPVPGAYEFSSSFPITGNGRFPDGLAGLAVDAMGDSFLTDVANKNVSEFDPNGHFVRTFGSFGTGNGQFTNVGGIAVAPNGTVVVADSGDDRVEVFTGDGGFVTQFGTRGHGNGQFVTPVAVAVNAAGNIFVADSFRVQQFTGSGQYVSQFPIVGGSGFLFGPGAMALDAAGDVFLTDVAAKQVTEFGPAGNVVRVLGSYGSGTGQFLDGLKSIAVDSNSNVLVGDSGNSRVQVFNPNGTFQTLFRDFGGIIGGPAGGSIFVAIQP